MSAPRKVFIGGNWKCNGDKAFVNQHCAFLTGIQYDHNKCDVCICPTFIHLLTCKTFLANRMLISAQNCSMYNNGAYTGEVSAKQIKDLGIDWTLIGHSERRTLFHEDEHVVGEKITKALENGLNIILCIGEKLEEREANKTFEVIENQMKTAFEKVGNNWDKIVIAYEPVWAIGTGKTATPEQAQEVHEHIRKLLKEKVNEETSKKVRIIYGGSANENNCNNLIAKKDIDGFLVGGASLKPAFNLIVESYKNKKFE